MPGQGELKSKWVFARQLYVTRKEEEEKGLITLQQSTQKLLSFSRVSAISYEK